MESRAGKGKEPSKVQFQVKSIEGNFSLIPWDAVEWKFHSESTHLSHPGFRNQGPEFRIVLSIRPEVSRYVIQLFSPVS